MTELDSVDRLLERARSGLSPNGADKLRTRAALRLPSAAPSLAEHRVGKLGWQALRASGQAGVLAATVLAGSAFGAGYWLGARTREPALAAGVPIADAQLRAAPALPASPPTAPPLQPVPAVPPAPAVAPAEPRVGRALAAQVLPRPRPPAPEQQSVPVDELALLRRVERALRAADPALALGLLAELEERFPHTSLGEERETASVMAHCGLDDAGAQQRAQRFLREQAARVYAERARAACRSPHGGAGQPGEGLLPAGHE